jgi:para-aminobenzoate synthetase component 1
VVADLDPLVSGARGLAARADEAEEILRAALHARRGTGTGPRAGLLDHIELPDPSRHAEAFGRVQRALRSGEVYQVNLTDFATARCDLDPWLVFEHQSRLNPVPFAAYLNAGEWIVSSHSPELLLSLEGERAMTAPIKGTWAEDDDDLESLRASVKDRAEHIMIVDLCRNDLGVSARYGSVLVSGLMEAMRLHRLVHMVSRIEARVPEGRRAGLLGDLFPGGSITGAPKRRAMEIIAQVESRRRGPYTGSFGGFGRDGRAVWNIAIRTAVWSRGELAFGCGGGIVLDSVAEDEYAEAVLKASSFFDTLALLAQAQQPARAVMGA